MRTADTLGALYQRVRAGQEPCRECRSAPAVHIYPWYYSGKSDAPYPDLADTHRALCAGCSANAERAQTRFAARTALVDQWQAEVRTSLALRRSQPRRDNPRHMNTRGRAPCPRHRTSHQHPRTRGAVSCDGSIPTVAMDSFGLGRPTDLVFVHFRDVVGQEYLRQGEPVTFEIVERDDRPGQFRAVHVRRILAERV